MDEGRGTKRKHQQEDDVVDLTSPPTSPPKARKSATAAISPRRRTANVNQDVHDVDDDDDSPTAAAAPPNLREIISVLDSDDEDDNNGYRGNAIHDIEGNTNTLDPLIDGHHLSVKTYTEFQTRAEELFKEVERLVKNKIFSTDGELGIGVDRAQRGPVYTTSNGVNNDPDVMKECLTRNNATVILEFIAFWEEICETNGLEIVDIWLTYYRYKYKNDMEKKIHQSVKDFVKFGIMLKHFDKLSKGVIARVTTTMFEDMTSGKVKKRFSMENETEGHADVSFSAGNGTTVILDSFGSGNTSEWRHGVVGAEGTYTITLQLVKKKGWKKGQKKTKKGGGGGKLKDDDNYPTPSK